MKLKLEAELKVAQMTDDFSVLVVDDNETILFSPPEAEKHGPASVQSGILRLGRAEIRIFDDWHHCAFLAVRSRHRQSCHSKGEEAVAGAVRSRQPGTSGHF